MALGELRNLKDNGSASLAELKDFLSHLRGRSPQEVIGIVKASLLIQSLIIATVATLAFLFVFTVTPYMIWGPQIAQKPKKAPASAAAAQPAAPAPAADATKTQTKTDSVPAGVDAEKAAKAMGMDETKTADPKANPLEKDFDKLLDGAK